MNILRKIAPLACLFFSLQACSSTIKPKPTLQGQATESLALDSFKHDKFDELLGQIVDHQGLVKYQLLKENKQALTNYYLQLSKHSPDSSPELFPSKEHRLAYWLNAYNASILIAVLENWPITSVRDVKPPRIFFFLPDVSGFFVFQKVILGGKSLSFYALENSIIRKRFPEHPSIHFALNCASLGCPRLYENAFTGETLLEQLETVTKRHFSNPENFELNDKERTIKVSSIFSWYKEDFGDLKAYLARHLPEQLGKKLLNENYQVTYSDYDWNLNKSSN